MSNTNKFKSLRLARAWSQEQLAELTGLSVRTVQRIENGDMSTARILTADLSPPGSVYPYRICGPVSLN